MEFECWIKSRIFADKELRQRYGEALKEIDFPFVTDAFEDELYKIFPLASIECILEDFPVDGGRWMHSWKVSPPNLMVTVTGMVENGTTTCRDVETGEEHQTSCRSYEKIIIMMKKF